MTYLIYLISFLEGFTTLSVEIIAIRNFTPIIGTNSISTSVILGVILLALSYGYYIGGKNSKNKENLKEKIILNLTISSIYYYFFTFTFDKALLSTLISGTGNYFVSVLISSFILFFIPVFFASQTIPLLSEMLKGENSGEKIGKLLFFSTVGSFFGSVGTSTVLFSLIGVQKSAVLNVIILTSLAIFLSLHSIKRISFNLAVLVILWILGIVGLTLNLNEGVIYKTSNSYQDIVVEDFQENRRFFLLNSGSSSGIDTQSKKSFFEYIKEIKEHIIKNKAKNILVLGAAGFTLPQELALEDFTQKIDVVDVDKSLKEIAEKYFLEEKLSKKINFYTLGARYFLYDTIKNNKLLGKKYDAVVIDVYIGKSLPSETLTKEFFDEINKVGDNIYINLISDRNLKDDFSQNVLYTMNSSFGDLYYKDVNLFSEGSQKTNFVLTNKKLDGYKHYESNQKAKIYTDDKNSIELDIFKTN